MNIQLIIKGATDSTRATEAVWRESCQERSLPLQVMDANSPEGQALVEELELRTLPALIVDRKIIAVGQPDRHTARKIVQDLTEN